VVWGFFLTAWAEKRGYKTARAARNDVYRAANSILRLAAEGRLRLCLRPPGYSAQKGEPPPPGDPRLLPRPPSTLSSGWGGVSRPPGAPHCVPSPPRFVGAAPRDGGAGSAAGAGGGPRGPRQPGLRPPRGGVSHGGGV